MDGFWFHSNYTDAYYCPTRNCNTFSTGTLFATFHSKKACSVSLYFAFPVHMQWRRASRVSTSVPVVRLLSLVNSLVTRLLNVPPLDFPAQLPNWLLDLFTEVWAGLKIGYSVLSCLWHLFQWPCMCFRCGMGKRRRTWSEAWHCAGMTWTWDHQLQLLSSRLVHTWPSTGPSSHHRLLFSPLNNVGTTSHCSHWNQKASLNPDQFKCSPSLGPESSSSLRSEWANFRQALPPLI